MCRPKNNNGAAALDRHWGAVCAAFIIHFVALGTLYSVGLYFIPLADEFSTDRSTTSWSGSLLGGVMLSFAAPAGALVDKLRSELLFVLGTTLLSSGLLCASFSLLQVLGLLAQVCHF